MPHAKFSSVAQSFYALAYRYAKSAFHLNHIRYACIYIAYFFESTYYGCLVRQSDANLFKLLCELVR